MATGTAAEMLLVVGDNPSASTRKRHSLSSAAFAQSRHPAAKRSVTASTEAATGRPTPPFTGVVVTRMHGHQPTQDYVRRRTAEGRTKPEIIRCLKRYVAREIFGYLCPKHIPHKRPQLSLDRHRSINTLAETINGLFKRRR